MHEDEALATYGLPARAEDLPRLRAWLADETRAENTAQGRGDTDVMRLICVQLFIAGHVTDAPLIWAARAASMDATAAIDLDLTLGAGLAPTLAYLAALDDPTARRAREAITAALSAGTLEAFDPAETAARWQRYYMA